MFFLTVYHHFHRNFGEEDAEKMFYTLGQKTDILICEMPGDRFGSFSFQYSCTNTKTNETYKVDTKSIWPRLYNYLPPGNYDIVADSDIYGDSNKINIDISKPKYVRGEGFRLKLEDNHIKLIHEQNTNTSKIDDVKAWYDGLIDRVFGDQAIIMDYVITNYKRDKRKDILYSIDTSNIEYK